MDSNGGEVAHPSLPAWKEARLLARSQHGSQHTLSLCALSRRTHVTRVMTQPGPSARTVSSLDRGPNGVRRIRSRSGGVGKKHKGGGS